MKLLFLQKSAFPLMGTMSISAFIKKHGYDSDLLLVDEEKDYLKRIGEIKPEVIALALFTAELSWALKTVKEIKKRYPQVLILLGGPHPTFYPEVIKNRGVDVIVRGEAEEAVLDLLRVLDQAKSWLKIDNLWVKKGRRIYKNKLRPLEENLDKLPFPDRSIYYQYKFLAQASAKQFLTGRGCPYHCSFCSNHLLRRMYQGKGCFVRRRSPRNVIREIKAVREKYGLKTVSFTDDVFTVDKVWLKRFLNQYKKEINLPFICNVTANLLDKDLVKMLKQGGGYAIAMGIETGNENLRLKVLKKNISNQQIIEGGRLVKKAGMMLKTYNILCLPGERLENAWETVMINVAIKPDSATASLLQPFPQYEITKYAIKKGFLAKSYGINDVGESIYLPSPMKLKDKKEIENLQAFFPFLVQFPQFIPLARKLIKWPPNPLFDYLRKIFYGISMSRVHRLTLKDMISYALHINPLKV